MRNIITAILTLFYVASVYASDVYDQYLSLLGFKLEETDLVKIRKKLGNAPIKHTGDAGGSYSGLCYVSPKDNVTVYFESGEMGGGNHTLLSFVVKNSLEKLQKCGNLAIHNKGSNIFKVGVLELGKDIKHVKLLLPQPVIDTPNGIQHKHFGKIPFTKEDIERTQVQDMEYAFWDVFISIEVFEKNDVVNGYKVSKITSW